MKKTAFYLCACILILSALFSGCKRNNAKEASSALTFSDLTPSISTDNEIGTSSQTSSTQKEETSSKVSSLQKNEVSSNKSSSTVSKISPNRNPSSQISSIPSFEDISSYSHSKEESNNIMPVGNFLGFPIYAEHTDVNQVITTTYKDNEINKQTLDKYQNIKDLNKDYPIECIIGFPEYYSVYYRQELHNEEYGKATVYFKVHYDLKGNRYAEADIIQATYTKAQFEAYFKGQTLKEILNKHPDKLSKTFDYPWSKSDKYAPASHHRTTDGYQLFVEYEIPEEDKPIWKEIRDNHGKGLTRELYYRWIVKNITVQSEF